MAKKLIGLSQDLDVSVWEQTNEEFKANKQFVFTENGETIYVGMLFWAAEVGGLADRKSKSSQDKGSVLRAVQSGDIKTYNHPEILGGEHSVDGLGGFIIIPTAETLDAMDEYGILTSDDTHYIMVKISTQGNVQSCVDAAGQDIVMTYNQVKEIVQHGTDPAPLLNIVSSATVAQLPDEDDIIPEDSEEDPEEAEAESAGAAAMSGAVDSTPEPVIAAPKTQYDDDADLIDDEDEYDNMGSGSDDDDDMGGMAGGYVDDTVGMYGAAMDAPAEEAPVEDIPADDVRYIDADGNINQETVFEFFEHTYLAGDLDLKVSTAPFDMEFVKGNDYIPFNENRGTGQLNEYLNNISRDANTRMRRLHRDNIFRMRTRYLSIMQTHCNNIIAMLDPNSSDTKYGQLLDAIETYGNDEHEKMIGKVKAERARLEEDYQSRMQAAMDAASSAAKDTFIRNNSRQHEEYLAEVEKSFEDQIERRVNDHKRQMNADRKMEAERLLELAVTSTLKDIGTVYMATMQEEQKEYVRLQNEMIKYIDANRKDEKARIEALAEQNRQVKRATEVRNEYAAKIKALNVEFDAKQTALQAEVDRINRENQNRIKEIQASYEDRLGEERAKSEKLEAQLSEMMQKYTDLDKAKDMEYRTRINTLEQENASWSDQMEHVVQTHRKANMTSVFLIIAIAIASIGLGFMFGSISGMHASFNREAQQVEYSTQQIIQQDYPGAYVPEDAEDAGN